MPSIASQDTTSEYIDESGRSDVNKRRRRRVWDKSKGLCWYCADPLDADSFHVDHFIAYSAGGKRGDNLVPSCRPCNIYKGSKTVEGFRESLSIRVAGYPSFSFRQVIWLRENGFTFPDLPTISFWFEDMSDKTIRDWKGSL